MENHNENSMDGESRKMNNADDGMSNMDNSDKIDNDMDNTDKIDNINTNDYTPDKDGVKSEDSINRNNTTKDEPQVPSLEGLKEEDLFKKKDIMIELKNKIKALLFASGKELTLKEITLLVRKRDMRPVLYCLRKLKEEYNYSDEPIVLLDEGEWKWRMTLKDKYVPVVEKIVTQTELPKSIIETLAVIAWKAPVTQSEVIHVRTNKAYGHIKELEELGYITTEKYGRTRLIKLAKKFFDYFDIDRNKLKENIQNLFPEKKEQIKKETIESGEEVYDTEMSEMREQDDVHAENEHD